MGSRRLHAPRIALTPLVIVIGLIATAVATGASWQAAQRGADAAREAHAGTLAARLSTATDDAASRLDDLTVAVKAARHPTRGGFDPLAGRIVSETAFTAIGYIRHVPSDRVAAFERNHPTGLAELTPENALTVRRPRTVHYPAARGLGAHLGLFDVGVDLVSRQAWLKSVFVQARDLGRTRATMPIAIPTLGQGTLLVAPAGRSGYVAGMVPFDTLVGGLRRDVPGARFALYDGRLGLGGDLGRLDAPHRHEIRVGGRAWTLAVARPRAAAGTTIAVAIISLLATLVLCLASRLVARRERRAEAGRLAAEQRSRQLAETSTDLLVVQDAHGRIAYLSPACRELLGMEPETLIGRRPRDLVHPDDRPLIAATLAEVAAGADTLAVTVRLRRGDGSWVWVETRVRVLRDPDGRPYEAHSTVRDISDRVASQTALEAAETRFRSTFEEAPIGMAITGVDGRFQRVNRALATMLGHPPERLEGSLPQEFTHPDDVHRSLADRDRMVRGETSSTRLEKRYLHANGDTVWVALSVTAVRDADGRPLFFLAQMQDITESRRHEAELRHLADHDSLTGLLNRRSFERELERHVAHVERYGPRGAAMVLDLDHFKTINDTLGHGVGDELICRVAQALRARLRASDVLARLGGDEFAILLPEGSRAEALEVAEGVLATVRGQAVLAASGHARRVSASLGVALLAPGRRLTPDAVLVEADLAMYEAKEAGRDRYVVAAGDAADGRIGARISWADRIRDALAEDRFVLHAQPIVDVDTGRIGQYELLLRMLGDDGELIAPGAFLPVAERFDLIGQVDRWVVRRAIAMLAGATRDGHAITIEVNLSGRSTGDPELLALIEAELLDAGVDPARVIFEITETTAVANIPAAQAFAARLADLGCRFALDDFGAGFGSFYYLKHLPFDYLKIDGEFVRHCSEDRTDQLVIQAVVDIARGLGKRTVAEQAGDDATMALLRKLGVDQAQGYFLGGPAPLEEWLARSTAPASAPAL